jgi:hypothetical protein
MLMWFQQCGHLEDAMASILTEFFIEDILDNTSQPTSTLVVSSIHFLFPLDIIIFSIHT